ncbi:translocation/assembly module TamB domain-containing protein [Coraliomargarita algicola]|uniref:Translocation/assembly module TamB domain-containing protein n=1 Tax=Coraliomargarita algicola TaxID=3092156 RepID=A0ABZ0RI51_9BACT|nr:translocation/assembly module TamB domain-containing protein [Coraliomargarita sp. J2-16]WPJ94778.1 translocation/assembly module TamB domain-containing protein [Coraliomargarita sp. J2-16]
MKQVELLCALFSLWVFVKKFRYIRILVRLLVYGLIGLCALWGTSIWWLPRAMPTLLRWGDVEVRSVQRLESGRLLFTELGYARDSFRCSLGRLEVPSLQQYLWERLGGDFSSASLLEVDTLRVELSEGSSAEPAESEPVDVVSTVRQAREALRTYGQWLPPLKLNDLQVHASDGAAIFELPRLTLSDWQLAAVVESVRLPDLLDQVELRAALEPNADWTALVTAPAAGLELDLSLEPRPEELDVSFEFRRAGERAVGLVSFSEGERLPVRAALQSERFAIDPEWLPSAVAMQWQGGALTGVDFRWEAGRYMGRLQLEGVVQARDQDSITMTGGMEFSGDLERLRLEVLQLAAGWGQLRLRQPLEMNLADGSVAERAEFQASVDLSQQAFLPAGGQIEASLSVAPSLSAGPNVLFNLNAKDLIYDRYQVAQVDVAGRWEGSVLRVDEAVLQPLASDAGVVDLSGQADLSTLSLDFEYSVALASEWLNTMVAPLALSDGLKTRGRIGGDWQRPMIVGDLEPLTVEYPGVTPISLSGSYQSEGWQQWTVAGSATAAGAVIEASFVTRLEEGRVSLDLSRFVWVDPVRPTLELQAPAHFSYRYSGDADFPESRFIAERFHLQGPELDIEVGWNPATGLELSLRNVTLQRLGRWVARDLPSLTIESVELSISDLRPHLLGSFGVHLETRAVGEELPLRVDVELELSPEGLVADTVQLQFAEAPLLQGSIRAPVRLQLPVASEAFWTVLDRGDLAASLTGSVTPSFAKWLSQHFGLKLSEAALNMQVGGRMEQPTGVLEVSIVSLETSLENVPEIDHIEIVARAEADRVQVEQFKFIVNQSEVTGRLSVPTAGLITALTGSLEARKAWLSAGSGRIELRDWQAENWVDYLPPIMRRSGRVSGSLDLQPDWNLTGRLSFQDFALRPTESLPSVDLIRGELELAERRFTAKEASAQVGGSPVSFTGWLDAGDLDRPLWEFHVHGLNVPLVRTTDMILRSDLDVQASHTNHDETAIVQGNLNLRSSTMLVEFDPLAPSVESGPQSKPPYFSIREPAIADWRFDLKIVGDSFMRVRSPYFRTQLTANFDLGGTFAEPLLIGTVRTVDGELRFPGARMRLTSGEAYIEPGQPNTVQLSFNGIAQKASYIITMDVTQTLEDPHVQFQSTPTLSNASIVRLLTTGSTSGGGVGSVGLYLGQGLLGAGGMDEQFSDRLTVDVGEETSRSGRNTVGVRYELSEDVFLEGGYDVYDAYNLDLIWSLFKR